MIKKTQPNKNPQSKTNVYLPSLISYVTDPSHLVYIISSEPELLFKWWKMRYIKSKGISKHFIIWKKV